MNKEKTNYGLLFLCLLLIFTTICLAIKIDLQTNKVFDLELENKELKGLVCGDSKYFVSRVDKVTNEKSFHFSNGWITEKKLNLLYCD